MSQFEISALAEIRPAEPTSMTADLRPTDRALWRRDRVRHPAVFPTRARAATFGDAGLGCEASATELGAALPGSRWLISTMVPRIAAIPQAVTMRRPLTLRCAPGSTVSGHRMAMPRRDHPQVEAAVGFWAVVRCRSVYRILIRFRRNLTVWRNHSARAWRRIGCQSRRRRHRLRHAR